MLSSRQLEHSGHEQHAGLRWEEHLGPDEIAWSDGPVPFLPRYTDDVSALCQRSLPSCDEHRGLPELFKAAIQDCQRKVDHAVPDGANRLCKPRASGLALVDQRRPQHDTHFDGSMRAARKSKIGSTGEHEVQACTLILLKNKPAAL